MSVTNPETFSLTILERFKIQQVLPEKGNFLNMRAVRKLREAMSLTDREQREHGIEELVTPDGKETGQFYIPRSANDYERKFDFSSKQVKLVRDALTKLEREEKLDKDMVSLWEKFAAKVEEDEDDSVEPHSAEQNNGLKHEVTAHQE
jgi:hypothetical protein